MVYWLDLERLSVILGELLRKLGEYFRMKAFSVNMLNKLCSCLNPGRCRKIVRRFDGLIHHRYQERNVDT